MQVLFPQFLWALGLLGFPIAIHLFNFQRPKRIIFSNVKFLRNLYQQDQAARTIKHYLVLASRILFLTFLILAFAKPTFDVGSGSKASNSLFSSIYIDNSYSMQRFMGQPMALDVALSSAEQVVGKGSTASQFNILTNDFNNYGQFFFSKSKAQDQLREVQLSGAYRDAKSIVARQLAAFNAEGKGAKPNLIWLSDFQKSTLGDLQSVLLDTSINLTLVPITPPAAANLYIDTVYTTTPFLQAGQKQTLIANIRNAGENPTQNLIVKLSIDGVQVSTAGISVPAGGEAKAKFDFVPASSKVALAKLELDDAEVNFDNVYHLVLNPAPKIKVVVVSANPDKYLSQVFRNPELVNLAEFSTTNIDYDNLGKADFVVVNGVNNADAGLQQALLANTKRGGSVLVIPAYPTDAKTLNGWISNLAPIQIQDGIQDSLKPNAGNTLSMPDVNDPFFTGVFEEKPNNPMLPFAARTIGVTGGKALLSLKDGRPLLVRTRANKGAVYMLTTSLANSQTDLPKQGLFVPIMLRLALLSLPNQQQLSYSFQDPSIEIPFSGARSEQPFRLVQGKTSIIPGQHLADGKLILEIPKADLQAGYFDLKRGDSTLKTIALNFGHQESNLLNYTPAELKQMAGGNSRIVVAANVTNLNQDPMTATTEGHLPLWVWCLGIALVFLLAEILLLRFFK